MAKKKKQSSFKGKLSKSMKKSSENSSFGYLKMPEGVKMYSPEPGKSEKFDIIPYNITENNHPDKSVEDEVAIPGSIWWRRPFKVHKNVGAENDTVVCPTSFGKKCPICEHRTKLMKKGVEKDEWKDLWPSSRSLFIVIPKGHKKWDEEMHLLDVSDFCFMKQLQSDVDEDEDNEIFPDLEDGLTLKCRWAKESFAGHEFAKASRIDFETRTEGYDESILEEAPNLDKLLKQLSYEEIEIKFMELDEVPEGDDEEEEDETPIHKANRKLKTAAPAKRKPVVEEDEDEDEEEEEEKPAPKRKTPTTSKKPVVVEEDDEDEDEDEDEDDEPPVVAKRKAKPEPPKPARRKPVVVEEEDEDEDEEEEDEPAPVKRKAKPEPEPVKGANKCPHGHKFGIDTEDFKECDNCKIWEKCIDAKEKKK